ncbi:hypothetical protein [Anthocerotibacter panamensis]|uniref:hypothetical protein n=1 Tax=Anthocerotibacter panamensis TaxID=2857077 RepID=UPI001C404414|nr:hypothetical protein [Anthocerotibacter panamensis]
MEATGYHHRQSKLLRLQGTYVDHSRWVEAFFCAEHGTMWLMVLKDRGTGQCEVRVPTDREWEDVAGLIDPNRPNPSVSEYSWRSSRGATASP